MDFTKMQSKFRGEDPRLPGYPEKHFTPPLRVMIIGAHPDDPDDHCAGLTSLLVAAGHRVRFVALCNGDKGHQFMDSESLAKRRFGESRAAMKTLGIEDYFVADTPDCEVVPDLASRRLVTKLIREFAPHIIVTHRPNDYHCDHRATSQLVQDATYLIGVPLWCPDIPVPDTMPTVLFMSDRFTDPKPFRPDLLFDVTPYRNKILRTLACHESQFFEWLPPEHGYSLSEIPPESDPEARFKFFEKSCSFFLTDFANVYQEECRKAFGDNPPECIEGYQKSEYCRPFVTVERELIASIGGKWLDSTESKWTRVK